MFSSPVGFLKIPGSEPVQLDLEKLFLLSVSKENLDLRGNIEKHIPYNILCFFDVFLGCQFFEVFLTMFSEKTKNGEKQKVLKTLRLCMVLRVRQLEK